MSKFRRAARIDKNQEDIVKILRQCGLSVVVGHDDILVGSQGKTYWYEIKEPETISKKTGKIRKGSLKESQKKLLAEYKGHYRVVTSAEEILEDIRHD